VHLPWFIDGGWFDITTFVVAFVLSAYKCYRHKHKFISAETGRNIVHGIAIFPLLLLALSVFSNEILKALLESDRLILAAAGFIALFSILEDEFERGDAL
jgi:FlaA1/EpsC-like NDP-sugar epimerase